MKQTKKILSRNIKLLVVLVLFVAIGAGITYSATTYLYESNVIGYDNSNSGFESNDVQGALDELYDKCANSTSCPDGYMKTQLDAYSYKCNKPVDMSFFAQTAVRDDTSSTYVTRSTGINFAAISSATNGQGLYLLSSTANNTYPIYYYRGSVADNNVLFANFCWKIVRTTETGGIKLIYNGGSSSGKCSSTGSIGSPQFNTMQNATKYIGYMYDSNKSSAVKQAVDAWYKTNIYDAGYDNYVEDTVWCNDRSISSSGSTTYYGARGRLVASKSPSLTCPNNSDKFTVDGKIGNGLLTYKVGLLTADEIAFAGAVWGTTNTTFYLYSSNHMWTMSPIYYNSDGAYVFRLNNSGQFVATGATSNYGTRPAISLKSGCVLVGSGTSNEPYTVVFE